MDPSVQRSTETMRIVVYPNLGESKSVIGVIGVMVEKLKRPARLLAWLTGDQMTCRAEFQTTK